eukprot:2416499-Amphidinium_carterae.2
MGSPNDKFEIHLQCSVDAVTQCAHNHANPYCVRDDRCNPNLLLLLAKLVAIHHVHSRSDCIANQEYRNGRMNPKADHQ